MTTLCASDIIRQAKICGNVMNVNMSTFEMCSILLNAEYTKLYEKIVLANGAFIKDVELTNDDMNIPEDCYHIIGLYKNNNVIRKSTIKQNIPGTYTIFNNTIKVFGMEGPFTLRYSILPQTLTAPDEMKQLDIDIMEVGYVTDEGFFYRDNDATERFFDFGSLTSKTVEEYKEQSTRFLDGDLIFKDNIITYQDTDVTHLFKPLDDLDIVSVRVSDPYVIINCSNNKSYIYYGFDGPDELNWNEHKGKETYGEVLGFTTNSVTGKGCIWRDYYSNLIYYTSFTPDTVLNYPSNTFFQLLIYRLAATLTSLNGVQNQYLIERLIPDAEVAFSNHLAKDFVTSWRMNNEI